MASKALARRTSRPSSPPRRRSAAIARAGGAIAKRAAGAAASAARKAKNDTRVRALGYGTAGAVVGAVAEAKVPQIPEVAGLPKQLLIGGVLIGAGFALKGKIAEGALYGGMGPFFAGVSSLAKRFASGGTLAGEFDTWGSGAGGGTPSIVAGEYDDIAR